MRHILITIARHLDSWTRVLDPLKNRLGLSKRFRQMLLPNAASVDREKILASLDGLYIQRRIEALKMKGGNAPHFYVLCVEGLGDVIAAEPVARALKKMSPQGMVSWVVKAGCEDLIRYNPSVDEVIGVESHWAGYALCKKRDAESGNIVVNCHFDGWRCSVTGRFLPNPVNPQINVDNSLAVTHILGGFSAAAGCRYWMKRRSFICRRQPATLISGRCLMLLSIVVQRIPIRTGVMIILTAWSTLSWTGGCQLSKLAQRK